MKKLRITVDGQVYDVLVEVLDDEGHAVGEAPHSPLPAPEAVPATPAPAPAVARSAARRPRTAGKGDRDTIVAPIAGLVQKVFVEAGGTVEAKAPVVLLEAMKMDTYIYAPREGTVASVQVKAGEMVQVGDCLLRYKAEPSPDYSRGRE